MHGDPGTGGTRSNSGDAGTGWISVGDAGAAGWSSSGDAGVPGTSGTFGSSAGTSGGCSFPFNGPGCPPGNCAAGTGNCGTPSGGTGGIGSSTGTGGTGGTGGMPACVATTPSFGVCFVSDADVPPLPNRLYDAGVIASDTATITDVGVGPAPASCESARVFGGRGSSAWWFQATMANGRVWTIGVRGLGNSNVIHKNDQVTLNLSWRGYGISPGFGGPYGELLVESATDGPLLWASSDKNTTSWVTLTPGTAECNSAICVGDRTNVVTTINGETTTLPSFGWAYLGGFFLAVGEAHAPIVRNSSFDCPDYYNPSLDAAALKTPLSGP